MPNYLRGTLDTESRLIILDESNMTVETSNIFPEGSWEIEVADSNNKTVIARNVTGESYGYGDVVPISDIIPLSINSDNDLLSINDQDDLLVINP